MNLARASSELADAGRAGSDAGTGLRTMLLALQEEQHTVRFQPGRRGRYRAGQRQARKR